MKRQFVAILIIIFSLHLPALARTIRVGKQEIVHSISAAIQAAKPGDTLLVQGGLYREKNIVIDKPLVLLGVNFPVLDGERKYEIISVKADDVTVKGFVLRNSGISSLVDIAGIKIYDRRNVSVIHNKLDGTFFGIYLQNAVNCRVEDNELTAYAASDQQSGNGIHCWKCDSICIIGNSITQHRDGIYFEFVTNSVIWRNHSYNNIRYGLHFMFSHNDAYISNVFHNNSAGVSVMFTHGVKMFNNVFEDNWGDGCYGIFLKEITDSYIIGNRFLRNTTAIFSEGSNRIQMQKNSFTDNGWGLKIQASCQDISVSYNNFTGNSFDVGTNGTLVLNTFNNNYWDKYEGYDLNKDGEGDIPYHPVSLYSMIVEKNPPVMILFRSFITTLMDKTEKVVSSLTPENLKDDHPLMKPLPL
jgi:nitrous oxidase accessory protein